MFAYQGDPEACVEVAGSFNGWACGVHRLEYRPEFGMHVGVVLLEPGRIRYRYVVNGHWIADPGNPLTEPNEFGDLNSVHFVEHT